MAKLTVGEIVVKLMGDTKQFATAMQAAAARMKAFGAEMQAFGSKAAMMVTAPLALAGFAASKAALDFESSIAQMRGLVGASEQTIREYTDAIAQIGPVAGKTSTELARASFYLTSAGLKGERAAAGVEALKAAAMGAAAGLGDTAVVADAASSAMNAYGEANLSANQAVAVLVATVREGKAEAASIAPVLGRLMPVAAQLGVGFDQVGASIAAMTRLGFDAATSATSLRATLVSMMKPAKQSADALAEYGLSFEELREQLRHEGLLPVLMRLKDVFGENEEAMARVFPNVRALAGVLAMVGENADATQQVFASLAQTTEKDLMDAFAAVEVTAGHRLAQAWAKLNAAFVRLGDDLLPRLVPLIEGLVDKLLQLLGALDRLSPSLQNVAIYGGLAAAALGPMLMVSGGILQMGAALVGGLGSLAASFGMVAKSAGATGGVMTSTAARIAAGSPAALLLKGSLVALVGVLSYQLMKGLLEVTGGMDKLHEMFGLAAEKSTDLANALAEDEDRYQEQLKAYDQLRQRLGLLADEWRVSADWTKENATRLSELTDKAIAYARQTRDVVAAVEEQNRAMGKDAATQVQEAMEQLNREEAEYVKQLKERYELQTADDTATRMKEVVLEYEALRRAGVDNVQLGERFNDELLHLGTLAKRNNVEFPRGFLEAGAAMREGLAPATQKFFDDVGTSTAQHIDAMPGKVLEGMVVFQQGMEGMLTGGFGQVAEHGNRTIREMEPVLRGGFGRGISEGVADGEAVFRDFKARVESEVVYIPVMPETTSWWAWFNDMQGGRVPNEGG